jgi:hypothetical protein
MLSYPQSRLMLADVYSVLTAWTLLALFMLGLIASGVLKLSQHWLNLVLGIPLFAFFSAALLHITLALSHRCPSCGKHPTVQGFKPIHPNAVPKSGISGWARVVWSTYRERQFVCIHCGASWHVKA